MAWAGCVSEQLESLDMTSTDSGAWTVSMRLLVWAEGGRVDSCLLGALWFSSSDISMVESAACFGG